MRDLDIYQGLSYLSERLAMKIYKCDICGKTVNRPPENVYTYSQLFGYPNKVTMSVVDEDGGASTKLSFDLCDDCGEKLYNSLKGIKNTDDTWSFEQGKETDESSDQPDA